MSDNKVIVNSNVVNEDRFESYVEKTLDIIGNALTKSLGYYGSTTVMETNLMTKDNITKDGYTILSKINFDNNISNTIMDMIREVSGSLVQEVGDGSTTSVIASIFFYRKLVGRFNDPKNILSQIPRKEVLDHIGNIYDKLEKEIMKQSIPINDNNFDIVKEIASVSNNNDSKSGNLIYDIFKKIGKEGTIALEERISSDDNLKDSYKIIDGITTNQGYVDHAFVNTASGTEAVYRDPFVLMFGSRLTKEDIENWVVDFIGSFTASKNLPIIFIAPSYDPEFINSIKLNINNNRRRNIELKVGLTTYDSTRDDYKDIETYLNAKILNRDTDYQDYSYATGELLKTDPQLFLDTYSGKSSKAIMGSSNTSFIHGQGAKTPEKIKQRVNKINDEIKAFSSQTPTHHTEVEIFARKRRIANLEGKIATLYISGKSSRERLTRKYLLDDSIRAVKSALKYGYIPGGNLIIPKILNHNNIENTKDPIDQELENILYDSMIDVYKQVLRNSYIFSNDKDLNETVGHCINENKIYNLKTKKLEADKDTTIINSARTDISILKAMTSIIGLLATSNQYISSNIDNLQFNPQRFNK